jgi:hypothetical protein
LDELAPKPVSQPVSVHPSGLVPIRPAPLAVLPPRYQEKAEHAIEQIQNAVASSGQVAHDLIIKLWDDLLNFLKEEHRCDALDLPDPIAHYDDHVSNYADIKMLTIYESGKIHSVKHCRAGLGDTQHRSTGVIDHDLTAEHSGCCTVI